MSKPEKWLCDECGWVGEVYLVAISPFDKDEEIVGCPKCHQAECLRSACDEPGCKEIATVGYPWKGEYRRTCHVHDEQVK